MTHVQDGLHYTSTHEWIRIDPKNIAYIGITDHAQNLLGDMVLVDLPEIGAFLDSGDECAVVESVKAASDVFTPLTGEVLAHNEQLQQNPGILNQDPYGDGWLFQIRIDDVKELENLLDAESYQNLLEDTE